MDYFEHPASCCEHLNSYFLTKQTQPSASVLPLKLFWVVMYLIWFVVKFIYSEKATKFCEIFPLLLTVCTVVKNKVKISQNFVAFSEYMKFT